MQLSGGIHLTTTDGYDARTASANADLKAGTVHGEQQRRSDFEQDGVDEVHRRGTGNLDQFLG